MNSILTVVTPATNFDLITLAMVKSKLGIYTTIEDSKITAWIKEASDFVVNYCRRVFAKEVVSEQFRLDRKNQFGIGSSGKIRSESAKEKIILSRFPVGGVTSVTEDGSILAVTDYEVEPSTGILYRLSNDFVTNWQANKVVIVYSGGYTLVSELPYDLQNAMITIVSHFRSASLRDPFVKRVEIPDVQTVEYWVGDVTTKGLPAEVISILDLYAVQNL